MKFDQSTIKASKIKAFASTALLMMLVFNVVAFPGFGQCKSFSLSDKGDTLNCIDYNGMKQGPWIIKQAALRGTPGYEEEGEFVNDKKEGLWRRFSEQGDPISVQTYKWGLLDGTSHYYTLQGLVREENWYAMDPAKKFDTIQVPDLYKDGEYHEVVIKNEGRSLKHGRWTYYDPGTGFVSNREDYFRDSAVNSLAMFGINKNAKGTPDTTKTAKKIDKPAVVQEWEKKNAGKKKVTVRDGSAGY